MGVKGSRKTVRVSAAGWGCLQPIFNCDPMGKREVYVLPDRIAGMNVQYEMAFLICHSIAGRLPGGLVKAHKGGIRHPITSLLNLEASLPLPYRERADIRQEEGEL